MKEYSHEEYIARNKRLNKGRWRLPTMQELLSLVDYGKYSTAITADITSSYYWSYTSYAWSVYFNADYTDSYVKTYSRYVCCVRDTQNGLECSKDAPTKMTLDEAMEYAESLNV